MKFEIRDPRKFGEKLVVLLQSPSLRHVKVMHDENNLGMRRDWAATTRMTDNPQDLDHRVKLEFKRRSCADKLQSDWIAQLYEEWRESVVTLSSLNHLNFPRLN